MLRSFVAVMVGFMLMVVLVTALTLILVKTMGVHSGHPTPGYLLANTICSLLAAAAGGAMCAWIAGREPLRHGLALAAVILVLGFISYRHYTGQQPAWYQAMMEVLPPVAVLGGAVFAGRKSDLPSTYGR